MKSDAWVFELGKSGDKKDLGRRVSRGVEGSRKQAESSAGEHRPVSARARHGEAVRESACLSDAERDHSTVPLPNDLACLAGPLSAGQQHRTMRCSCGYFRILRFSGALGDQCLEHALQLFEDRPSLRVPQVSALRIAEPSGGSVLLDRIELGDEVQERNRILSARGRSRKHVSVGEGVVKIRSVISRQADIGALLDVLVRSRHYVPPGARRIRSQEELPLSLQSHTKGVDDSVWRAWSDDKRIWFVTARAAACEDAAGLQVMFFDMDGRLASSGVWIWLAHRGWVLSDPNAGRRYLG